MKTLIAIALLFATCATLASSKPFSSSRSSVSSNSFSMSKARGFVENNGQMRTTSGDPNSDVLYSTMTPSLNVQLRKTGFSYDCASKQGGDGTFLIERIDVEFLNCSPRLSIDPFAKQPAVIRDYRSGNYEGVSSQVYETVTYKNVYDGVDVRFSINNDQNVEYDIIVYPHGRLADVQLGIAGPSTPTWDDGIVMKLSTGELREHVPAVYVLGTNENIELKAALNNGVLSFAANHSASTTLVIDPVPVLTWGTYFGGGGEDYVERVTRDVATGDVIVTGRTQSTTGIATSGSHQEVKSDTSDGFIARFDSTGKLLWATYYGGELDDILIGSCIDAQGNIYSTGLSYSRAGIGTPGTFQPSLSGGSDIIVVKFDKDGARQWGTYFGGATGDEGMDIGITPTGKLVVVGIATSDSLATQGQFFGAEIILVEFTTDGVQRNWATYYGGNGYDEPSDLSITTSGEIVVVGWTGSTDVIATSTSAQNTFGGVNDMCVAKFDSDGSLMWGTYLGGEQFEFPGRGVVDASGNIYVSGYTQSFTRIATQGTFQDSAGGDGDGLLVKYDPTGRRLWGTYIGGNLSDDANSCELIGDSVVVVVGTTSTDNFHATTPAISSRLRGNADAFVSAFTASNGAREWSTYIGGNGVDELNDVCVADREHIFVGGRTQSSEFISTPGAHQEQYSDTDDGFLMKIALCDPPNPSVIIDEQCFNRNGNTYSTRHVAGNLYHWSFPPEAIIISGQDSSTCVVFWQTTGQVSISVLETSPLGCDNKGSVATVVLPELRPDVQSVTGELETCEGDTIFLKAQDGLTDYKWNTGDTGQVLAVTETGFYQVTASDTICRGTSDSVSINILPAPLSEIVGASQVCLNGSTQEDYSVEEVVGSEYLWDDPFLGNALSTLDTPILSVEWTQPGIDTLHCLVSDVSGCSSTGHYEVVISDSLLPTISSSTGSFVFCEGDSILLQADSIVPVATFLWSTGETTSTIVVKISGDYWVELDDGSCMGTSALVTVTVSPAPSPAILGQGSVCRTDEDSAVYAVQNVPGNTYSWIAPVLGTIVTPTDQSQITIQWNSAGIDTVGVIETAPGGCFSTAGQIVTISEGVTVSITESAGELIADFLTADEYRWLDENLQPIVGAVGQRYTPTVNGKYYVEVRTGACWSRSVSFTYGSTKQTDMFSVSDVDFGSLPINAIINASGGHVNEIIVVNLSQTDISLDSASLQGVGFDVPNQFPRLLRPGDTSRITVRFLPTQAIEYIATVMIHFGTETGFSQLRGIGRDLAPDERITEVILQPDRLEVVPGERFEVILKVGTESPTATTAQQYEATMQWDARVLELISTPEVYFKTTGREDNYYTAKVPEGIRSAGQIQLIKIPFRAKLGEIDSTVLVFSGAVAFRWKDDTKAFAACRDSVVHVKICAEGGRRLITKRSTATIAGIAPHPIDDRSRIFIVASSNIQASIDVIDQLGTVVRHHDVGELFGGRSDVQLDMSGLHAGPYILRLNYGDGTTSRLVIRR